MVFGCRARRLPVDPGFQTMKTNHWALWHWMVLCLNQFPRIGLQGGRSRSARLARCSLDNTIFEIMKKCEEHFLDFVLSSCLFVAVFELGEKIFCARILCRGDLVPYFEETVPAAGAHGHPVLGDPQAGHAVVVAGKHACNNGRTFSLVVCIHKSYTVCPRRKL